MANLNFKYNAITLVAAIVASLAAMLASSLGLPVWAMFVGWVAFFTGSHSPKGALMSYSCMAIGIALGNLAVTAVGILYPQIDYLAFGPVVLIVATLVVSLRTAKYLNNIPAYFLGLIAFFAAHLPVGLETSLLLWAVAAVGTTAALIAHVIQRQLASI